MSQEQLLNSLVRHHPKYRHLRDLVAEYGESLYADDRSPKQRSPYDLPNLSALPPGQRWAIEALIGGGKARTYPEAASMAGKPLQVCATVAGEAMSVLVVGSVAYDSVETLAGSRDEALGGSATFFSISAGYFAPVSVVAVVGEDFRPEDLDLLSRRKVDISGLERRPGKSFRWSGAYSAEDVNERTTLDTQLSVFADFSPTLSPSQRRSPYVFLANIDPDLQLQVLEQMESRPRFVALDTMNFWIEGKKSSLRRVVSKIDALFVDEAEVREFAGEANVVKATRRVMNLGPTVVIVKRGDHGVIVFNGESAFAAPAFPLESVVDPTGAGDSFAGGFMGYLAATGDLSAGALRRATVLGSVMGSFAVESFSVDRLSSLAEADIESRFRALTDLTRFEALADDETLPWGAGR